MTNDEIKDMVWNKAKFISEENEKHAIKHVELAKKMDVQCKLNYAMASGEQAKPYPLSKIYKTYEEIYRYGWC